MPVAGIAAVLASVSSGPWKPVLWWLAAAVAIAITPRSLLRAPSRWPSLVQTWLPRAILIALVVLLLGELLLGQPPATRDHGIHYFQTRVLVDELLPTGRVTGWSTSLNNGYPFGETYPFLGYLWMAIPHLLTFGAVPLRISYAWGMLAIWLLMMWGVWSLAQALTEEIVDSEREWSRRGPIWAGLVGAGAWLLDPGASREGGWEYVMFHGVWPQLLSTALWTASLVWTWRCLRKPSMRRLALATATLGASLLAHPFGMLTAAASALAWAVSLAVGPTQRLASGWWRWWMVIHGLAGAIAAGWLTTFFLSAEAMHRTPVPWRPLATLVARLVRGELFHYGHLAWTGPLAFLGLLLALIRGRLLARWAVLLLVALLIAGSDASITVLRLDLLVPGFKNLQFPRYAFALKPLWFAFVGVATVVLARGLMGQRPPERPDRGARVIAALVLAPLAVSLASNASRLTPRPIGAIDTLPASSVADSERALTEALLRAHDALPPDRSLKVAFLRKNMRGGTYPLFAIADAGADLVIGQHVPAVNYRHRVERRLPQTLGSLGVTHVVYDRRLPKRDVLLRDALGPVERFGQLRLARLQQPSGALGPVGIRHGEGRAVMVEQGPDHRRIEVDDLEPSGARSPELVLTMGPHWRWKAALEGQPLALMPTPLVGNSFTGTTAVLPHAGLVTLHYQVLPWERGLWWCSIAAMVITIAGLFRGRPLRPTSPNPRLGHRKMAIRALLVVGGAALVVALAWRQTTQLARTWQALAPSATTFNHDLVLEDRIEVDSKPSDRCESLVYNDPRRGCSEAAVEPRVSMLHREPYLYRCLLVTLPPRTRATLKLRPAESDRAIRGMIRRVPRGGRGKRVRWRLLGEHDKSHALGNRLRVFRAAPGPSEAVTVRLANRGSREEQVCIAAAGYR